ncbi:MAG: 23S rRNA (uracil(1939)-C(5))-methyltransferase RlmD [Thiobacillaceae bacterium]|nr:23S rRNA (uracil(1939)-C(5))-methyltransferase RlmD [Thiobacillaceae bacterium]MCX7673040.1 23S rRNA (uracil(1939)-C(5))-methyltransferase RlmD [Thiobacillaceae bacterium]MDW8323722.1 23S rRNA (uracil(1939)-C(5))-methyltransferase RlmD [Burkholderiales bacterium]
MEMLAIESLDHEGRGVAHRDGKVVFVEGALAGEVVEARITRSKPSYALAELARVLAPSPYRVSPRCRWFGICGGCSHQHLDPAVQVAAKQRVLEDCLAHIGKVEPEVMLAPIHGPAWGYRRKARLAVRYVARKGGVLVGFHERRSSFVADMLGCEVLPPAIGALLPALRELVEGLSLRERLPQIEVAVGERVSVLVLRHLQPFTGEDEARLRAFAEAHGVQLWLQPQGPDSAHPFHPLDAPPLDYRLPEFDLVLPFRPTDFTQVNHDVNRVLVRRAMQLLAPSPGERIADFFCGVGNFSLPIARLGAEVLGVEGAFTAVQRALDNARLNGLEKRCRFQYMDLFQVTPAVLAALGPFDKWLIDPPRDGAIELVKALPADAGPRRIVYISCNPATLARDAAVLVHTKGYRLKAAGVANMFPHTAHVESIAWFERGH